MEGFTVATASNGREGLERLVALGRPCMILLDLMMPVMDGHEFLDRLATRSALPHLPGGGLHGRSGRPSARSQGAVEEAI